MKVLVVKTSALGDIIHTFPVVNYLKKKMPTCQIDWVVESPLAELIESHPNINFVHTIDTKQWRRGKGYSSLKSFIKGISREDYDVVFDLQGNIKSALVTFFVKAVCRVGFGVRSVAEWPNVLVTNCRYDPPLKRNIREDYLSLVKQFFGDENEGVVSEQVRLTISREEYLTIEQVVSSAAGRKILVCPGAAWENKRLGHDQVVTLLQAMEGGSLYFAWGSEAEKVFCESLQEELGGVVIPRFSLPVLQNFMCKMDIVVAMDSLPLHLAGTTGVATLSVFGPSLGEKYRPLGEMHRMIQGECPYGIEFDKRCPKLRTCPTGACIKNISDFYGDCSDLPRR